MLKRKNYFVYKNIFFIPSCFVVEGHDSFRLKTKEELKKDIFFYARQIKKWFFRDERFLLTSDLDASPRRTSKDRRDPTIDQYIIEHGGIKSHVDNKVYKSKNAYLSHLKEKGYHIN